jgi:lysophospholipase L1-like esterase
VSRFLALGDSYTVGEQVAPDQCWPSQLTRVLRRHGVMLDDPEIVARTGWTTDELAAAISAAMITPAFELVSLSIGVNNQYRGGSLERYHQEFVELLVQAIGFAGGHVGHVVVASIPDWGVTPFASQHKRTTGSPAQGPTGIAEAIDRFNAVNRHETLAAGARYVDITAASRERHGNWLAADGLHPSGTQYARWAELVTPAALAAFATI